MHDLLNCKWEWYWRTGDGGLTDCGIFAEPIEGQAYAIARCPRYVKEEQWREIATHICELHNAILVERQRA